MDNPQALIDLIGTLIYVLPLCVVIYKGGKQSQRVDNHEERITKVEKGQESINELKLDIKEIKTSIKFIQEAVNEKSANISK